MERAVKDGSEIVLLHVPCVFKVTKAENLDALVGICFCQKWLCPAPFALPYDKTPHHQLSVIHVVLLTCCLPHPALLKVQTVLQWCRVPR